MLVESRQIIYCLHPRVFWISPEPREDKVLQGGEFAPHALSLVNHLVTEHKIVGVLIAFVVLVLLVSIKNIIVSVREERNKADRED